MGIDDGVGMKSKGRFLVLVMVEDDGPIECAHPKGSRAARGGPPQKKHRENLHMCL